MVKVMDHVGTYLYRGCPAVPTFRHESGGAPGADDLAAQHQHLITADLRGPLRTLLISQLTNGQVRRPLLMKSAEQAGATRAFSDFSN